MADYGLSGHATEASIAIPGTGSLGRVFATSTDGDDQDEWNDLRSGGFSETLTANHIYNKKQKNRKKRITTTSQLT